MGERIIHGKRIIEVLRDKVKKALSKKNVDTSEMVEFYIVNLLKDFHSSENVFGHHSKFFEEKPLSIHLLEAMSGNVLNKGEQLRWVGDKALLMAGFFGDNIYKRLLKPSYYISIGESAYGSLADIHEDTDKTFHDMYFDLSANFVSFVDVLSAVAPWNTARNAEELLKIYERWEETKDESLREILVKEGILSDSNEKDG